MMPSNYSFLAPSENAEHTYKRLRYANTAFYILMGIMAIVAVWNVVAVTAVIRESNATDLSGIRPIQDHISSRIMNMLGIAALALFVFKEWKWGDRSYGMVFILAPFVFLWLVPVMSAEIQPNEESVQVVLTINQCEPGAIEGGEVIDSSLCTLVSSSDINAFMTGSDPMSGDPDWLEPDRMTQFGPEWQVEARGSFRVYFLVQQPSMEQCNARLSTSVLTSERHGHHCLERSGEVWLVQAFETSGVSERRLIIYQESLP